MRSQSRNNVSLLSRQALGFDIDNIVILTIKCSLCRTSLALHRSVDVVTTRLQTLPRSERLHTRIKLSELQLHQVNHRKFFNSIFIEYLAAIGGSGTTRTELYSFELERWSSYKSYPFHSTIDSAPVLFHNDGWLIFGGWDGPNVVKTIARVPTRFIKVL